MLYYQNAIVDSIWNDNEWIDWIKQFGVFFLRVKEKRRKLFKRIKNKIKYYIIYIRTPEIKNKTKYWMKIKIIYSNFSVALALPTTIHVHTTPK